MHVDEKELIEGMERLEMVLGGHVFFQTLRSAVEFDLFTLLARNPGASMTELAGRVGIEHQSMRILLLGCTALGLVERRGDGYHNSETAQLLLSRDSTRNITAAVEFAHKLVYRPMFHLYEALRTGRNIGLDEFPGNGKTFYERLSNSPELERLFQAGLQSTSATSVQQLSSCFDFGRVRHVLDVGGGNGTALCSLLHNHPHLKGTVFETPTVCALAREQIAQVGMSDRIGTFSGNSFTDPFPEGADCILFMHFMTIWSERSNRELFRKSYEALPVGGLAIVFDGVQSNDQTGPLRAARWSPYFLVLSSGEGMFYTGDEYAHWMREAGFVDVNQIPTPMSHAVIVGQR
ncbi:MAG: acetylserotonin O-methyltransferase [Acidobacteriota bacterium]|nr:acetylserotonin O-methyltransferase [Acidobacteriota bacterium]